MISPETTSKNEEQPELTQEQKDMLLGMAREGLRRSLDQTKVRMRKLSTRGAFRVLNHIGQIQGAENLLSGKQSTLKKDEQELVEWIFELQQNVMGYIQLLNETAPKNVEEQEGEDTNE